MNTIEEYQLKMEIQHIFDSYISENEPKALNINLVSKSYAIALETTDDIVKGKKYEITEVESMGYHIIIDKSGTEAYYHHSVLNVC